MQNLQPLSKAELNNVSARFAGAYIETAFRKGREVEKQLVLNCVAHGYYMGARNFEDILLRPRWWRVLFGKPRGPLADVGLFHESVKAGRFYLKRKGYLKLAMADQSLILASVTYGFREGYSWRKTQ